MRSWLLPRSSSPGSNVRQHPPYLSSVTEGSELMSSGLHARRVVRRRGGHTALHLASSPDVASMLLAGGIDHTIACRKGLTAAEKCLGGSSVQAFIEEHRVSWAILRMQNGRLAAALAAWVSHAQELCRLKMAATRVVERMQHSATASAFAQWATSAMVGEPEVSVNPSALAPICE